MLLLAVFRQAAGAGGKWLSPSAYGSFLLSEAAGGYVLAGVIAFAAGVIAAVLVRRNAENKRGENDGFIERKDLEEGEGR